MYKLDAEEQEILDDIENDVYVPVENQEEEKAYAELCASNYLMSKKLI